MISGERKARDISFVARSGLCTGCGTCVALCPQSAIRIEIVRKRGIYLPRVNEKACNACGICLRVCPGRGVDFAMLNQVAFGHQPQDNLLGNYIGCYTGHAADKDIRYNSSSGGLVSALLIFALERGMIDGALVTRMNPDKPLEPQPFIARTEEEILSAAGSKYCPVPANIALDDILKAKEGERFAVVGLPCHMHGLRKAELVNSKLKERVALRVGLFCGSTANFAGTRLLLGKMRIKGTDVIGIKYRGTGWPGHLSVEMHDSERKSLPYNHSITVLGTFFTPKRCQLCLDGAAELADISFGDAWLPRFAGNEIGESILILRNEISRALIEKLVAEAFMELVETNVKDVIISQKGMIYRKKKLNQANTVLLSKGMFSGYNMPALNLLDYTVAVFQKSLSLYQVLPFDKILENIPQRLLELYSLPFAFAARVFYCRRNKN